MTLRSRQIHDNGGMLPKLVIVADFDLGAISAASAKAYESTTEPPSFSTAHLQQRKSLQTFREMLWLSYWSVSRR